MSNLIQKTYNVVFLNPSISFFKWDFDGFRKDRLKEISYAVAVLVCTVGSVFLGGVVQSVTESITLTVLAFLASYFALFFLTDRIRNLAIKSHKRKRDEYRRKCIPSLIQLFEQKGWEIVSLDGLVKNKKSYILNENKVRHSLEIVFLGETELLVALTLSDEKAQADLKVIEQQEYVDFQVEHYENTHGTMSPEEKTGFIKALNETYKD